MEEKNQIASLLKSRQCLKMLPIHLYPSREETITSLNQAIENSQKKWVGSRPKEERYEIFRGVLDRIKFTGELVNSLSTISSKRIPILRDVKPYARDLKYAEKAGLIFSLKEGRRKELFLNLGSEKLDFTSLPYFWPQTTAIIYISMSDKYFKTAKSILMSLKSTIRPSIDQVRKILYHYREEFKIYRLKDPETSNLSNYIFRLKGKGKLRKQNIVSLAGMLGLLEEDLLDVISPIKFKGDWVLDWNENEGLFFNEALTRALMKQYRTECKILLNPSLEKRDDYCTKRFIETVKKHYICPCAPLSPTNPLIITDEGKNYLEKNGEWIFNLLLNNHINTKSTNKNTMNRYLRVLYLLRDYGPLSCIDIYQNFNLLVFYKNGFTKTIRDMLKKGLICYSQQN